MADLLREPCANEVFLSVGVGVGFNSGICIADLPQRKCFKAVDHIRVLETCLINGFFGFRMEAENVMRGSIKEFTITNSEGKCLVLNRLQGQGIVIIFKNVLLFCNTCRNKSLCAEFTEEQDHIIGSEVALSGLGILIANKAFIETIAVTIQAVL